MKKIFNLLIISFIFLFFVKCKDDKLMEEQTENQEVLKRDSLMKIQAKKRKDSLRKVDSLRIENEKLKYEAFIFPKDKRDSAMGVFLEKFNEKERYQILAINRLDDKNKWRADTLVIPNRIEEDFLLYSPYPKKIDSLYQVDKMAFFSYEIHAYGIYENGNLVKWGPTSMGKKATPTLGGLQFTNWKKELAISTSNSSWKLRWNFNIHNYLGFGWHQYDLPGFHASHSCMRLLEEDAEWLYHWADQWILNDNGRKILAQGTPVLVFGDTDFKSRPWLKLSANPKATSYTSKEMNHLLAPFLNTILKEQVNSKKYRMMNKNKKATN